MSKHHDNLMLQIFETLNSQDADAVRSSVELLYNGIMKLERQRAIGAGMHERSEHRCGYANGYKAKTLNTRMGPLQLEVPQTRGLSFYPACLEKGCRSERALKLAIAEMYLKGVSTRKVTSITEELCGLEFTSSQVSAMTKELDEEFKAFRERILGRYAYLYLDATYLKIRHTGSVISLPTFIAYGVNQFGRREIVGVSTGLSEAEVHWRTFLESLQQRGLCGLQLITSDDHTGLRNALRTVFPSVPWQRCQFHMSQNAQQYAPKKHMREEIAQAMRDVFHCSRREDSEEAKRRVIDSFSKKAPEFVDWFSKNIDEGLTCLNFPRAHQKRIRTVNGLERVNREIKRRVRVAVLFPNAESALRLVTGILVEIHEEWVTGWAYLDMSRLDEDDSCHRSSPAEAMRKKA